MHKSVLAVAALPAMAMAASHTVMVGPDDKLVFVPDTLTAAMGDTVTFEFYSGDHGVASGSFSKACAPSGDIWSGYINPTSGMVASKTYTITVDSTDPLALYCPQSNHCEAGMVMVINPSSTDSLAAYQAAAMKVDLTVQPTAIGGGVFGVLGQNAASSSSVAASTSVAASSSSAAAAAASASSSTMVVAATSTAAPSPVMSVASTPVAPVMSSPVVAASTTSALPVSQISDGQPQATTAVSYTGGAALAAMPTAAAAVLAAAGAWGALLL